MSILNLFADGLPLLVKRNILRLYIIKASKWFMLIMPIVVPFYEENGLSLHQIMILKAIYSIAIVIFEIPSGYLADILGRKNTLIAGSILGTIGFICYSFSFGFWAFVIAEIILGAGQSLISGADSAMLYDTLNDKGLKDHYSKYEGRTISLGNFCESLAGLLGGLLAVISLRYPYYAQSFVALAAVPAALTLYEPGRKMTNTSPTFRHILYIVRYSLIDNKKLRSNILLSSMIGTATLLMAWFVQPIFGAASIPLAWYGIIWTFLNILVGITALWAYKFEIRFGPKITLLIICLLLPLGFVAAGLTSTSYYSLIVIAIFYLVRGIATPVLKDYINRDTDSDKRATVLSVRSFILRINFAIMAPLAGWLSDTYSLMTGLIISGSILAIVIFPLLYFYLSRNAKIENVSQQST